MTIRTSTKDPDEDVTLEFDFTELGTPTSPEIEIEVVEGEDEAAEETRLGSATVVGDKVFQRMTGGLDGVEYAFRCFGQIGADRKLVDLVVPVVRRPGPAPT